jgi:hypothetical protein
MSADDLKAMLADIKRAIADDEFSPNKFESGLLETVTDLINFELKLTDAQDQAFEEIWKKATGQSGDDDPSEDDFM